MSYQSRFYRRSGAALAIALTMLAVTGMLLGGMLRGFVGEQRQLRIRHFQWQAQWLARSAMERAQAQLAANAEFTEEDWKPEIADARAEVAIRVKDGNDEPGRIISATASFPVSNPVRARFEYTQGLTSQHLNRTR